MFSSTPTPLPWIKQFTYLTIAFVPHESRPDPDNTPKTADLKLHTKRNPTHTSLWRNRPNPFTCSGNVSYERLGTDSKAFLLLHHLSARRKNLVEAVYYLGVDGCLHCCLDVPNPMGLFSIASLHSKKAELLLNFYFYQAGINIAEDSDFAEAFIVLLIHASTPLNNDGETFLPLPLLASKVRGGGAAVKLPELMGAPVQRRGTYSPGSLSSPPYLYPTNRNMLDRLRRSRRSSRENVPPRSRFLVLLNFDAWAQTSQGRLVTPLQPPFYGLRRKASDPSRGRSSHSPPRSSVVAGQVWSGSVRKSRFFRKTVLGCVCSM